MSTRNALSTKFILVVLALGLGLAALPTGSASASGLADETTPPAQEPDPARLERAFDRLGDWYTLQSTWMGNAEDNIARIQHLIDKASARGQDTAALQAALDAFAAAYPQARVYNEQAAGILVVHAGFDASGKVTDPEQALETVRSLRTALRTARETMNGTGQALKDALRAFRQENRPVSQP